MPARALLLVSVLGLCAVAPAMPQEVAVAGVVPGGVYSRPVTPQLVRAWQGAPIQVLLNGQPWQPGTTIAEDGQYVLEFRAADLLGHPLPLAPITFAVDSTPPEILFVRPPGLPSGVLPRVRVRDANPDPQALRLFLDGKPYRRSDPLPPGDHVFEATTVDRAGNFSRATQQVTASPCQPETFVDYVPPATTLSAAHYFLWHTGSPECPASSYWCNCI